MFNEYAWLCRPIAGPALWASSGQVELREQAL